MKIALLFLFAFPIAVFGQGVTPAAPNPHSDTALRVIRLEQPKKNSSPAVFVNGKHVHQSFIKTIDQNQIEEVTVLKDSLKRGDPTYNGEVLITMKESYHSNLISLDQLKSKYVPEAKGMAIITVDGEVVKEDYTQFYVDESNLLTIYIANISIECGYRFAAH
ncbi:hypothetical protein [Parapedobacter sp. DT-150]|uniref:hypothetical protein n=1 Tax=Parapedobacter sp. DT-150 TaxID=3396162 RepID=UPI003F1B3B6A